MFYVTTEFLDPYVRYYIMLLLRIISHIQYHKKRVIDFFAI